MECRDQLPEDQYVFVQVRTGVPKQWVPEIARGLNTSVQVQDMSLDHLKGLFEWIKEDLRGQSYYDSIAWSENDDGKYDARDLIALMYMLNIDLFPGSAQHPIAGYEKKSEALRAFEQDATQFQNTRPILRQILYLHDYIAKSAVELYNRGAAQIGGRGRGKSLKFIKSPARGASLPFLGANDRSETILEDGALYPVLAAFRVFVRKNSVTGKFEWIMPFEEVKQAWNALAYELIKITHETSEEVGRSNNAIGKSRTHWNLLYQMVENFKLRKAAKMAEAALERRQD